MNKKTYSQVFDAAAREHVPDHVDLTPHIMARIQKGKGLSMNPKLKILVTALAVLTIFAITLVNGPTVVHALQALFGYIPGVGTVDSNGLRVLAEPVSQTKDGVTVTIQQGMVDSSRTILTMTTLGLTSTEYNTDCLYDQSKDPQLHLPNGTAIPLTNLTGIGPTRYDLRYYFPALPADVNDVTLEIPCLLYSSSPSVAFEIPLRFDPATDLHPFPVIEVDPTNASAQTMPLSHYGIVMTLEQVVPLDDGYLFSGSLKWGDGEGPLNKILSISPDALHVVDAAGHEVMAEFVVPDHPDRDIQIHEKQAWSYKVSGKEHAWPLTLSIKDVYVIVLEPPYRTFQLDMGLNPQIGQTWALDEQLTDHSLAGMDNIQINSAALILDPASQKLGILFQLQTSADIVGLQLEDAQGNGMVIGLHGAETRPGFISNGFIFQNGIPSGTQTFMVGSIQYLVHDDWRVIWQP